MSYMNCLPNCPKSFFQFSLLIIKIKNSFELVIVATLSKTTKITLTCTNFTCIFAYIWLKSTPWKIKSTFHFLLCFSSSKGTLKVQKVHLKYSLTKRIYIFFIYSFNESTIYYPEYCKTNLLYFFIKHCKTNNITFFSTKDIFSLTIPFSHITNIRFLSISFMNYPFFFIIFTREFFHD